MSDKLVKRFVIGTFVSLYALVSIISTIHVIDFFKLSNPYWLAVTLAIGFEIGAAASLASLVILKKMNKTIVWSLFLAITLMQMQGNMYYAFINLEDFKSWSELFYLIEEDLIDQKRILSFVSGAILPLIALGFIKSLVDYIRPEEDMEQNNEIPENSILNDIDVDVDMDVDADLEPDSEELYDAYVDRQAPESVDNTEFFKESNIDIKIDEDLDNYNYYYDEFQNYTKGWDDEIPEDWDDEIPEDWDDEIPEELDNKVHQLNRLVEIPEPKELDDEIPEQEQEQEEEWDEDHMLDMVMNNMVMDPDFKDFKKDINPIDLVDLNSTQASSIVQKMDTSHLPQDEDLLYKEALRKKADEEKKAFIKNQKNDNKNSN